MEIFEKKTKNKEAPLILITKHNYLIQRNKKMIKILWKSVETI